MFREIVKFTWVILPILVEIHKTSEKNTSLLRAGIHKLESK